jgi:hypothetical protein
MLCQFNIFRSQITMILENIQLISSNDNHAHAHILMHRRDH